VDSHINVLVYNHIPAYLDRYEKLLRDARPDVNFMICHDKREIASHINRTDVILSGHTFPVELLSRASNLKWIQSISAGVENYVLSGAVPSHATLTKVTGVHGPIIADYVLGYMLAITLKIRAGLDNQKIREWPYYEPGTVRGKTAGVMGLGSVGSVIALRLHQAGLKVIGFDEQTKHLPFLREVFLPGDLMHFLSLPDFVVMALPLSPRTKAIIGGEELKAMKTGAYLFNISRGPLIHEEALVHALRTGDIAGAVLDVFEKEPLPKDHELWNMENVYITPHISGPSLPEDVVKIFLENLKRFEMKKRLKGVVDFKKGY